MNRFFLVFFSILLLNISQGQKAKLDSLMREAAKSEIWQPVPPIITPGNNSYDPPSDAIILFSGKNFESFEKINHQPVDWILNKDGSMSVKKGSGNIQTKDSFGSCQLHLEYKEPEKIAGSNQTRGNSGIYFMLNYEVQVLDNYDNPTYSNGQAGSVYKQHSPLANACKKPGEWQTYDIIFMRPIFSQKGQILRPATITAFHNGVLILNHVTVYGKTLWIGSPYYEDHPAALPLLIQDHGLDGGEPVSFRNIWLRKLEN